MSARYFIVHVFQAICVLQIEGEKMQINKMVVNEWECLICF